MKNTFKIRHRKNRNFEVCFNFAPTEWKSTGTKDNEQALLFIQKFLKDSKEEKLLNITFSQYLEELNRTELKELKEYDKKHGKLKEEVFYNNILSISNKYILPLFENCIISKISLNELNKRIENSNYSNSTKNRVINTLKIIYKLAILDNLANENLAEKLEKYKIENKETLIFTQEELNKLFREDINYFSSEKWKLYFLILRDTGWRPSEVASLKYTDIDERNGGISNNTSIVYNGKEAFYKKSIKTSTKGQDYKIGALSKQTLELFRRLNKKTFSFIFLFNGKLLLTQTANRELKKALKRANIEDKGRTQYSFRHTFNTKFYFKLEDKTRLELMGHMHERKEYLHLTKEERLNHLMKDTEALKILMEA